MNRAFLITAMSLLVGAAAACGSEGSGDEEPLPGGGFPDAGGSPPCDADGDGVDGPVCHGADCDDGNPQIHPGAEESCDTRDDDDCDGHVNEGCGCTPGDMQPCFEGEASERGVGHCADGYQVCKVDGTWGACTGSVTPEGELTGCDGIDSNCNGLPDDAPECGDCPPDAEEVCGNGLDDDCDGEIDPPDLCTASCAGVNPRAGDAGDLACCLRSPPAIHEFLCHEGSGLDACVDRACIDLDGTLDTRCSKLCDGGGCRCGRRLGSGELIEVADCGFLSPCARLDCDDRDGQPCYGGPPRTLGVGICHGGVHSCDRDGEGDLAWDECEGQQVPVGEVCGNGLDDDCDGYIDEADGSEANCSTRARCAPGAVELCGNGLDDDCDGFADEACPAASGARQSCWTGSLDARGVGTCKDGSQREADGYFGPCSGEVLPRREVCGDELDTDCNGLGGPGQPEEAGCCTPKPETCNGLDDDCDGLADEGLVNRCGQCEATGSCFGAVIDDVGDCSVPGRVCEGVEPSRFDPSLITLVAASGASGGSQNLYAVTFVDDKLSLIQVDVGAGEINWPLEYPGGGLNGVTAGADGSAWVQLNNRMEHVSPEGEVICRTDTAASFLAPDPEGDMWVNLSFSVRRYSATEVIAEQSPGVPWPDGIARCAIVDLTPEDPGGTDLTVNIANEMVHDGTRLWLFGSGLGVQYLQVDENRLVTVEPTTSGAWFANPVLGPDGRLYGGAPLRWLDPEEAKDANPVAPYHQLGNWTSSQVGVLSDSSVVTVISGPSGIVHVDGETGEEIERFVAPADLTTAIAVDGADRVWATASGKLLTLDMAAGDWNEIPVGGLVGIGRNAIARGTVVTSKGRWAQYFDPGAFDVQWRELTWDAHAVPGTRVKAQVHFADSAEALETSEYLCGPFSASPADLSTCSGGRRYALVELLLSGSGKPVAGNIRLTWDRP